MRRRAGQKAEELLIQDYQQYYRLAYPYVRSEQDALDVVQESAYKAIKGCRKVKQEECLDTWITPDCHQHGVRPAPQASFCSFDGPAGRSMARAAGGCLS